MGLCALMAKLGGVTTMLLDLLKVYWQPAPVLTMGIFATLAGMAAANFPETAGVRLAISCQIKACCVLRLV